MTTDALRQLEGVRRAEVERREQALVSLRREQEQARQAHHVAQLGRSRAETALRAARQSFSSARSVTALRCAEAQIADSAAVLDQACRRCEETVRRCRAADLSVRAGEAALAAAELGRRAVARTREQRAHDVGVRAERRLEDDVDDSYRAAQLSAAALAGRLA
jgi:hypothetical protein